MIWLRAGRSFYSGADKAYLSGLSGHLVLFREAEEAGEVNLF